MTQSNPALELRSPQSSLLRGLARAAEHPGTTVLTLPATVAPLEVVLECFAEEPFCLLGGMQGAGVVGVGVARELALTGELRVRALRSWLAELAEELQIESCASGPCPAPRILGGLSFAPTDGSRHAEDPWQEFPDGYFVLPRWTYLVERGRGFLYLALDQREARDPRMQLRLLNEHATLSDELDARASQLNASAPVEASIEQLPFSRWREQIDGVRALIRAGGARKIVTARSASLALSRRVDPASVLRRMASGQSSGTRFGVRLGRAAFLGCTPETLFHKSGNLFVTHALAGTLVEEDDAHADPSHVASLLSSEKDGAEHAYVSDEIRARLSPLCQTLISDASPRARKVRKLIHLETHFSGVLSGSTDAAELLSILHPTPAIGGTPTEVAVDWIRHHEATPRGWYTGAVGWLDLRGDGHFSVAIRSGLVAGRRAHVFAGAGIVESSDARAEFLETHAKQEPFLWALGLRSELLPGAEAGA